MLEVLAILTLLAVGAVVFGVIALLAGLIKFTFKLALLPLVLGLKALVSGHRLCDRPGGGRPGGPRARLGTPDSAADPRRHRLGRDRCRHLVVRVEL